VVALDDDDFDPGRGLLLVRHAKLGRHRLLPLHPATATALLAYQRLRDQRFPRSRGQALLVSSAGTRLLYYNVGQTFAPGWPGRQDWPPVPATAAHAHPFPILRLPAADSRAR
jgi:integrase